MNETRKEILEELSRRLQHRFREVQVLDRALTHSSYVNEMKAAELSDNERLEFLGDAVLQLSVSELLYERFPGYSEGDLSKVRASLVTEHALSRIARRLDIGRCLLLGRGEDASGGRNKDSLLSDAFEAVIAALFVDGGYEVIRGFVRDVFTPLIDELEGKPPRNDFKSRLQERSYELYRMTPLYRIVEAHGPDHDKTFSVEVSVTESVRATGSGKSKKEAEQQAARLALEHLVNRSDDTVS